MECWVDAILSAWFGLDTQMYGGKGVVNVQVEAMPPSEALPAEGGDVRLGVMVMSSHGQKSLNLVPLWKGYGSLGVRMVILAPMVMNDNKKRTKKSPNTTNRTRNGKDCERQSQLEAEKPIKSKKSTETSTDKVKVTQ
ncbi:hypothetical protein Tco_0007894 [Tanacetum coccineum]